MCIYQDKIHNIWHYDNTNPEKKDSDIDINLSYVNPDNYKFGVLIIAFINIQDI